MSIRSMNRKIVVKGDIEPTPTTYTYSEREVTTSLPLWQLNILEAINEKLTDEHGCQVWFSYMKD